MFSLYTISGGIRITGDLQAHPLTNAAFMAVGAVLASFIGTTGAAMLLIRPLLETNRERKHVAHTVVFFIFIVCNCGGCLLPIGDPPLFLGYLQGVPFLWTLRAVAGMAVRQRHAARRLLAARWALVLPPRNDAPTFERDVDADSPAADQRLEVNVPLLVGVVLAVALLDPSKPLPGTDWHPWMYLREIVQLCLVAISLWFGEPGTCATQNQFNYGAIIEVAALFIGIFICMQPALQILGVKGDELGLDDAAAVLLGHRQLVERARQRADVPRVLQNGPGDADTPTGATLVAGVEETHPGGDQPGRRVHGRDDLHRQRAELHGPGDRRDVGREDAELLRLHGLQLRILLPILALMVWLFLM